ncbi:hypothetical protein [Marinobacterium sp. xm-d-530]|uniref:hypothetical protein n=1 Tax=Marinobacterium sp. xm-d-530 TaxID=2497747 RepID=UPI00156A6E1C|nr:hypothetical protein [Marinobacterium sp. xm-d-530]NRQ00829.1 hypothetical protein [Marinobacterium sp. xm-d-530]
MLNSAYRILSTWSSVFILLILSLASLNSQAQTQPTQRLSADDYSLNYDQLMICTWVEETSSLVMRMRQKGKSQDYVTGQLDALIKTDKAYDGWRDIASIVSHNNIVLAFEADQMQESEIDWAAKDFGVFMYNYCLMGEVVGWDFGTVELTTTLTQRALPQKYNLSTPQLEMCEWVEENAISALKMRNQGLVDTNVNDALKRKFKNKYKRITPLIEQLIGSLVQGAYTNPIQPKYLSTISSQDYGVQRYNQCVEGNLIMWK